MYTQTKEHSVEQIIMNRHSIRSYIPDEKIDRYKLENLLKIATKAPSGGNLQTWRFLIIDNQKEKEKLYPITFNQKQILDSSAVIVFLGDLKGYEKAPEIYKQAISSKDMDKSTAMDFEKKYYQLYSTMSSDDLLQTVTTDVSLVAMQFILLAESKGYSTMPMKGMDTNKFKKAFNISDNYIPVLLVPIGHKKNEPYKTSRLPIKDLIL